MKARLLLVVALALLQRPSAGPGGCEWTDGVWTPMGSLVEVNGEVYACVPVDTWKVCGTDDGCVTISGAEGEAVKP